MASISSPTKKRNSHYFVQEAPADFIASFVELCTEMIIRTCDRGSKHRSGHRSFDQLIGVTKLFDCVLSGIIKPLDRVLLSQRKFFH